MAASGNALIACHHKFINNPDSPGEVQAFKAVIESMLPSVGIKAMTILEPVGPAFPFLPRTVGADDKAQHGLDAYTFATHLGDGKYHVGNYDQAAGAGQLHRVYANQVAVCARDPVKTADGTFYIYPVGADVADAKHAESVRAQSPGVPFAPDWEERLAAFKNQCSAGGHPADRACSTATELMGRPKTVPGASAFGSYALVISALGAGAAQSPDSTISRAGSNAGGGGLAMPAVSASLQENRVGAFLRADDCYADRTVREPTTETDFHRYTETLGQIEWRSVAEVFQYLGAVLRRERGVTWTVQQEREIVGSSADTVPETMFALRRAESAEGKQAMLKIDYAGDKYAIGSGRLTAAVLEDQSLLVLSLLSELVNTAKISSDIPVSQQLQVLP